AFDEFAGKQKKTDKALVDIMKNYMANKSFSRGVETLGAEASMVFVGNTQHTVPYMLKHSDLFDELPPKFYDSAFLDRLHFYIPGWEVDIIRGEMFSEGYGFVVDYLAEILRSLRNHDYSNKYQEYFDISGDISTRDRDGIHKTFSGLMKILYPSGNAPKDETEEILKFAIEGRKRVKDQLMRIDSTYGDVKFFYSDGQTQHQVSTLEELEYPNYYNQTVAVATDDDNDASVGNADSVDDVAADYQSKSPVVDEKSAEVQLKAQHIVIQENQKGISYDSLFGDYLSGATSITLTDPYIRKFFQARNVMELLETIARQKQPEDEVNFHLVTVEDDFSSDQQLEYFEKMQFSSEMIGIHFTWEFDSKSGLHARHIVTDTGWKISLDRGLDIFQQYEMNDAFSFANRMQKHRACRGFEVTYIKQ
ncbi:MAG: BREX system Lon protease-like protein BrxL, partial [Thalassolituus sp.]